MKLELSSKQRADLRSKAQTINPVVMVGQDGITEEVANALKEALACHELVKVRFQKFKKDTRALSEELEKMVETTLVSVTGFTAVFYTPDPEKNKGKSL